MSCPDQTEILNVTGSVTKCEDAALTCVTIDTPVYYASSDDNKCVLLGGNYSPAKLVGLNFDTWGLASAVNPVGFKCTMDDTNKKSCISDQQLTDSLRALLSQAGACNQYIPDNSVQASNTDDYPLARNIPLGIFE